MAKHRTAIMGLGVRGKTHLKAMLENPDSYEIVGICDIRTDMRSWRRSSSPRWITAESTCP